MLRSALYVMIILACVSATVLPKSDDFMTSTHWERNNEILQGTHRTLNYEVNVQGKSPIHVTDELFLSYGIGISDSIMNHTNFNYSSVKLQTLARALSPAYIRLGGIKKTSLTFKNPCDDESKLHKDYVPKHMCPKDWDGINKFCSDTGMKFIFGLNLLLRTEDGQWDPTNAEKLLDYNTYDVAAWELGNEPNSYLPHANISISGSQVGRDFNLLRSILQSRSKYAGASVLGPDINSVGARDTTTFLKGFLSTTQVANATTFHSYYLGPDTATVDSFLDPETLDRLLPYQINLVKSLVAKFYQKGAKVCLGESGSVYGGGSMNLSDRYVAGFLFLDKLGMSAKMGLDIVIRESLYGSHYTMLDLKTLDPKPDYWSAYIYKYLVGTKVLHAEVKLVSYRKTDTEENTDNQYVRVYAHCTSTSKSGYDAGAVTLIILNMHKIHSANITLLRKLSGRIVDQYLLTPNGPMGMTSLQVNLNNHLLQLTNDTTLPQLKPVKIKPGNQLLLPPLTYGFYVVNMAKAKACMA